MTLYTQKVRHIIDPYSGINISYILPHTYIYIYLTVRHIIHPYALYISYIHTQSYKPRMLDIFDIINTYSDIYTQAYIPRQLDIFYIHTQAYISRQLDVSYIHTQAYIPRHLDISCVHTHLGIYTQTFRHILYPYSNS